MAVLELLGASAGQGESIRPLFALGMIDALFNAFGFTEDEAIALLVERERPLPPGLVKSWGQQYRGIRQQLESLFGAINGEPTKGLPPGELAPIAGIVARFADGISHHAREYRGLASSGDLDVPARELLMSFTHMHVNRLLIDYAVGEEMSYYNYLRRLYQSCRARRSQDILSTTPDRASIT